MKALNLYIVFTLSLQSLFAQQLSLISEPSNTIRLKTPEREFVVELIQPIPPKTRGEAHYVNDSKLVVKGKVSDRKRLIMLTVNGQETKTDEHGYFVKEIKVPYLESSLVVKAFDSDKKIHVDSIMLFREMEHEANSSEERKAKDYALLIGTDIYESMNNLVNPVADVKAVSMDLANYYKFETDTVINPTLDGILSAIRKYSAKQYNDDDQLMIYVAGHGEFDPIFKEGYIVPRDAIKGDINKRTYLDYSKLKTIVNNIPCKHILVVLDVCFGGTFDQAIAHRGLDENNVLDRQSFVNRKLKYKTRMYLTSGGKEYVPDGRPGHHSPFTRQFLAALRTMGGDDKVVTIPEMLSYVDRVTPEPRKGEFGDNEPGSDFLFIIK